MFFFVKMNFFLFLFLRNIENRTKELMKASGQQKSDKSQVRRAKKKVALFTSKVM